MGSPQLGPNDLQLTLGPQLILKQNVFQGFVIRVAHFQREHDVSSIVLEALTKHPRLQKFEVFSRASRVCKTAGNDSSKYSVDIVEKSDDDMPMNGVGDRLLYLLQRWQVINVALVVAHYDFSLSRRLLSGVEMFKLSIQAAKLALKQDFLDYASVKDTTEATNASASTSNRERLQQVISETCNMTIDTGSRWSKNFQPSSDRAGRKSINVGHQKYVAADRIQEVERAKVLSSEGMLTAKNVRMDWLGISRDEWQELHSIRVPNRELHCLFICLVILVETPIEQHVTHATEPGVNQPNELLTWAHCRRVLTTSYEWSYHLGALCGGALTPSQAAALHAMFQQPTFTESAHVRIAGSTGAKIFAWLQSLLDDYDKRDIGVLRMDVATAIASPFRKNSRTIEKSDKNKTI